MKIDKLKELAKSVQGYVVGIRRNLHMHPELRFNEERTLATIRGQINELDAVIEIKKGFQGGLVVDMTFDRSFGFNRLLFRADIDALQIPEETGLPFASQVPGVSHACGHDIAPAMLLGAIELLADGKAQPTHNFRFVFQRAEEDPITESGGAMLVREGVLAGISRAYGLSIYAEDATAKAGQFQTKPGRLFSNSGRLKLTVKCAGGHVAFPNHGSNATDILTDLVVGLRHFAIGQLGPIEPISFVPASMAAGDLAASNQRPNQGTIWFAVRHFLPAEKAEKFLAALDDKVRAIVSTYPDARVKFEYFPGHPATINSPSTTERIERLLQNAGEDIIEIDPVFGGEDFAHYIMHKVPGTYMMLGAWQPGCGGHHTSTFNPDESVFWKGVLYWLLLATS